MKGSIKSISTKTKKIKLKRKLTHLDKIKLILKQLRKTFKTMPIQLPIKRSKKKVAEEVEFHLEE